MYNQYGDQENETCNRNNCKGIIKLHPVENCSCHISPPCSACTTPKEYCPVCDWNAKDDIFFNDYKVNVDPNTGVFKFYTPRQLDNTKIDYHIKSHSSCSQLCIGVYPEGTTQNDVLKLVNGTFGGKFTKFNNGQFEFIAYTD